MVKGHKERRKRFKEIEKRIRNNFRFLFNSLVSIPEEYEHPDTSIPEINRELSELQGKLEALIE